MDRKQVVLITGSSGFIGSLLAKELVQSYQVVGFDYKDPAEKIDGVRYHSVDITSDADVHATLLKVKEEFGETLASVIHLVAYYNFNGEEDERYQSITIEGTRSLIVHLRDNFNIEQFIFSSSMLVYAPVTPGEKIVENSPLDPNAWAYPRSKIETEKVLQEVHHKVPVVNLRIAGIYDDFCHQPTTANQIVRIFERWVTSVPFPGNADHGQSFLHLEDLIEVIPLLINKRQSFDRFETFILGEEETMSHRELQKEIGTLLHQRPWPVVRVPAIVATLGAKIMGGLPFMREPFIKPWMIPHSDDHQEVDISKFRKAIGWSPKRSLRETLPRIIENLRDAPSKWYAINKIERPFYRSPEDIAANNDKHLFLASYFNFFMGLWLLANPFTFGDIHRFEFWGQVSLGILISVFALLSVIPTLRWFRWVNATLGFCLLFLPLVFESPQASAYSNDTLIGGLILLASVYTPSPVESIGDSGIPPGWSYNPSTAGQRIPIMFLAFLGFLFSRYLAAYQLGHIESVWDPFFGDGTARVLTSDVSKAFPISDAGLGALTYLLDVIAASIGGRERWRTMPWAVVLFGLMIIPAGVTSIVLVMLQPISVGAWCALCLLTAFIMLLMVPPAIDEVLASIQFLSRKKKTGHSLWQAFWLGDSSPERISIPVQAPLRPEGSILHLLITSLLGVWLMLTPEFFGIEGISANNIYVVSALIVTFSVIAYSEVGRICRLVNIPLALWLGASAWFIGEMPDLAQWYSLVMAILIGALSLPPGRHAQSFGSANRFTRWTPLNTGRS